MSAWLVTDRHIDLLVTAMIALDLIEPSDADRVGDVLWAENVKSLRWIYTDPGRHQPLPAPGSYRFVPAPDENLPSVYVAATSYRYQSCEHPTFPDSEAARLIRAFHAEVERRLTPDVAPADRRQRIEEMAGDVHQRGYWSVSSRAYHATSA